MNRPVARPAFVHALVLGAAADLLLHDGPMGIGFPIWIALLAVSAIALVARVGHAAPREALAWLAGAMLFSAGLAWRNSGPLQALDVLATGMCLAMTAVTLRNPQWTLLGARVRDALWALFSVGLSTAAGIVPVALRAAQETPSRASGGHDLRAIVRAVALSAVILAVFGSLLLSADPIFANLVSIPELDFQTLASHAIVFGFFTWIVAGWTRGALDDRAVEPVPERLGFTLSTLDITMSLGVLNVLFATFVGAQLAWFFGGETYLRAHTGLTVSAYARRGFFELVWVAVLVVPLLLGTRAAIAPDASVKRRHTTLSLPLIAMLFAMMISAVLRMRLYVQYYGLTIERFYPLVFMGWLAIVIVLLSYTVFLERERFFFAGAVLTGLATLVALNVANPDAIVARINVDRAAAALSKDATGLDVVHLATLSGDAVERAATAVVSSTTVNPNDRCTAAKNLLLWWGPSSHRALKQLDLGAWRAWNSGEQRGLAAITAQSAALQSVIQANCTQP